MIVSISGPSKSGKSTIISLLKYSKLPKSTIFIDDLYQTVWQDMVDKCEFTKYSEIHKDSNLLFMYIYRVCKDYDEIVKKYSSYDGLVIMEGCYIDYLIYTQLSTWFHYPLTDCLNEVVLKFLSTRDFVDKVYMTTADDASFPIDRDTKFDYKTTKVAFRRNRNLELSFYDIYKENKKVTILPPDILSCDTIIVNDLNESVLNKVV